VIVSIHQPEHFPYLGFFQKMQESDLFIILDNVKFKKNNFQNRNRFLNKSGNEEWFTLPVEKKANSKLIRDVKLAEDFGWKKKLMKQMKMNFNMSNDDLNYIYMDDLLYTTNLRSITYCASELDIDTPRELASELDVSGTKSELLYNLCKKVGATTYLSGQNGFKYLDKDVFKDINIEVFEPKVDNYYTTLSYIKDMK
tara:strand:+ start:86 stop:679 length:594 start_codon:yes stop_codon:yes gene_type:complete